MMTKISMKLQYPKTVGDAAVVRLEQIWKAVELGHVAATESKYRGALQSWRANVAEIIAKAAASAKRADWDQSSRNEIRRLRDIEKTALIVNDEMIEAALRAFYRHTAVTNFPTVAKEQMERALEAALKTRATI